MKRSTNSYNRMVSCDIVDSPRLSSSWRTIKDLLKRIQSVDSCGRGFIRNVRLQFTQKLTVFHKSVACMSSISKSIRIPVLISKIKQIIKTITIGVERANLLFFSFFCRKERYRCAIYLRKFRNTQDIKYTLYRMLPSQQLKQAIPFGSFSGMWCNWLTNRPQICHIMVTCRKAILLKAT